MTTAPQRRLSLAALLFLLCAASLFTAPAQPAGAEVVRIETATGERVFTVEIADDALERARGLMHRFQLPRDAGMLFVFESPRPTSFWMKNTPLPLDILFADEHGVIISIARNTIPYSTQDIPSGGPVLGVLEINGGLSDEFGVAVGDRLEHPVFTPGG